MLMMLMMMVIDEYIGIYRNIVIRFTRPIVAEHIKKKNKK